MSVPSLKQYAGTRMQENAPVTSEQASGTVSLTQPRVPTSSKRIAQRPVAQSLVVVHLGTHVAWYSKTGPSPMQSCPVGHAAFPEAEQAAGAQEPASLFAFEEEQAAASNRKQATA